MRVALPLSLTLLACGGGAARPPERNVPSVARQCPAADAVTLAVYTQDVRDEEDDEGAGAPPSPPYWRIPLTIQELAFDDNGQLPDVTTGPVAADALGRPPVDQAWIYGPDRRPCRLDVTGYERVLPDESEHVMLAARAEGCAPDPERDPLEAWAVIGVDPAGCELTPATRAGGRDAEPAGDGETLAMPAATAPTGRVLAVLPRRACVAPDCELLWRVDQAIVPGLEAYEAHLTWMHPKAGEHYCTWEVDAHHAVYVGPPGGTLRRLDTGDEQLALAGVLRDGGGARLLLTESYGVFGVHEVTGGQVEGGRVERWFRPHEEEAPTFTLGPYCGP